ncbi:hypothetical protein DPMN_087517 [Dreissena polymorpha]|uniref:Secreted protein n=1 Tax=Dreissena polymorpha TaxID=45954 RepID=A0A9D4KSI6_DREPO|nr:hypothetical protein DPMN_087517 [Dreissena polymorpha]
MLSTLRWLIRTCALFLWCTNCEEIKEHCGEVFILPGLGNGANAVGELDVTVFRVFEQFPRDMIQKRWRGIFVYIL